MRLLLAILLLVSSACAVPFTASVSGDMNNPVTWGFAAGTGVCHSTIPCGPDSGPNNGDTITVANDAITISCGLTGPETCSFGDKTTAQGTASYTVTAHTTGSTGTCTGTPGGFHLYANSTLIYSGSYLPQGGCFIADQGSVIQYDGSWATAPTTINYIWATRPTALGSIYQTFQMNGVDTTTCNAKSWMTATGANPPLLPNGWDRLPSTTCHVIWSGDSMDSPHYNSAATCVRTSSGVTGGCNSGSVGVSLNNTNSSILDSGNGTFTNFDITGVGNSTTPAWNLIVTSATSTFTNFTMTHSGQWLQIERSGGTASVLMDHFAWQDCIYATAGQSCFINTDNSNASGTRIYRNGLIDGNWRTAYTAPSNNPVGQQNTWLNVMSWSSDLGAFPHLYGGQVAPDSGIYQNLFYYARFWKKGTNVRDAAWKMTLPGVAFAGSIVWMEKGMMTNSGVWGYSTPMTTSIGTTAASGWSRSNVFGIMTNYRPSSNNMTGGNTLPTSTSPYWPYNVYNNVLLCDSHGWGSIGQPNSGQVVANPTNTYTYIYNNTSCATTSGSLIAPALSSNSINAQGSMFAIETTSLPSGLVPYIRSNNLFNLVPGGTPMAIVCGGNNAVVGGATPVTEVSGNVIQNADTSTTPLCTGNSGNNGLNWVATSPGYTSSNILLVNRPVVMVDPWRSVPLFDEYLDQAGYMPGGRQAYYTAQAGSHWKGMWAPSTIYSPGDVVMYQSSAVTSTIATPFTTFNNRITFWRCISSTSGIADSTSEPIVGVGVPTNNATIGGTADVFWGHEAFWEEAYLYYFVKPWIYSGKTFSDGALGVQTANTTSVTTTADCGIICLMNAWLRAGFANNDPTIRNHCQANPPAIDPNNPNNNCGALGRSPIQFTNLSAVVN